MWCLLIARGRAIYTVRSAEQGDAWLFVGMLLADLLIRVTTGRIYMPSTINLYQIGVWFCVGFFTGAGWAIAAVLVGRILSIV